MSNVTIAHLSDLHFAPGKDHAVWERVCLFLNEEVQPHLVLVTGDVTDNATDAEFEEASRSLGMLRRHPEGDPMVYRIIPGNHDRFFLLGNTFFGLGKSRFAKDKGCRFANAFQARLVTTENPCDLELPTSDPMWHPRIIGIDSNDAEQCFAQGYVSTETIAKAVTSARGAPDRDLVIALVHHHVLPIPELEAERSAAGIKGLLNVTGLLNSGTLLSRLSRAHVDLVLHGHEHKRYQARFSSVKEDASSVVVLAAGSGTGAATGENFNLKRVHFNVLDLQADRTVRLRQVSLSEDGVLAYEERPQTLLSAWEVRRSRFIRRNNAQAARDDTPARTSPRSRLKKLVRFNEQRDIEVTETRTDWVVGPSWTLVSGNSSGQLGPLVVECQWAPQATQSHLAEFLPKRDAPDLYIASVPLVQGGGARKAERITSTWTWHGGAVLTDEDVQLISNRITDPIRQEGREYTSVHGRQDLESLSITIQLPFRFAPNPEDVDVRVLDMSKPGQPRLSNELRLGMEFCGRSIIELRVPYPLPQHVYYVTWPVSQLSSTNAETEPFCTAARSAPEELIAGATAVLSRRLPLEILRVGLYVQEPGNRSKLDRVGGKDSPPSILLSTPRGLPRIAWWGSTAAAERDPGAADEADRDFSDDECILAVTPVRGSDDSGMAAVGLIRLGLQRSLKNVISLQELTALLADAASDVLSMARRRY